MRPLESPADVAVVRCADIDAAIAELTHEQGYRLDMIMPADQPRVAELSRGGERIRLEMDAIEPAPPDLPDHGGFLLTRAGAQADWTLGRAGMRYRDLIPGRLGGRFIGSHICIPDGGPVADYVHYHQVRFQLIYCLRGWVRVVYEDQGEPFVLHPGDCVLQPPTIRHRVLEASDGLEVLEIGGPAEHPTFREHALDLPTTRRQPARRYGGQGFVRHVAAEAHWLPSARAGLEYRDTGVAQATDGFADARVFRALPSDVSVQLRAVVACPDDCALFFVHVLAGELTLLDGGVGTPVLGAGDSCVVPTGADFSFAVGPGCEFLQVSVQCDGLADATTRGGSQRRVW